MTKGMGVTNVLQSLNAPLPITPCNLIPISTNDDEAEWDVTLEQGEKGRGAGGYMPQCITSQCVGPAGQRADDREGVG